MKLISKIVAVAAIATLVVPALAQAAPMKPMMHGKMMAKKPMMGKHMKKAEAMEKKGYKMEKKGAMMHKKGAMMHKKGAMMEKKAMMHKSTMMHKPMKKSAM